MKEIGTEHFHNLCKVLIQLLVPKTISEKKQVLSIGEKCLREQVTRFLPRVRVQHLI